MSNLVVIGLGYVGLPMALRAGQTGHSVVGLDLNARTVALLNKGVSHIDDVKHESLRAAVESGRFRASTDPSCLAEAEVVIVCVPTPLGPDGGPDLSSVEDSAKTIGQHVSDGALVILESTTYPGTTEEVFAPLLISQRPEPPRDLKIAFSPERINPGDAYYDIRNTPKVVGGLTTEATQAARALYATFIDKVIPAKRAREAEMSKLLENTFRHVNIALVNEMVRFCDTLDIDLWDAISCAETKPFGFMAFRPGPGVGGHCIPVDPSYLSHRVKAKLGYAFRMVELAEEINHAAPLYVATRVWEELNKHRIAINGAKVLLLGVTYKPNISDLRETPAEPLADQLIAWGAELRYCDPLVPVWHRDGPGAWSSLTTQPEPIAATADSDIVVLLQNHQAFDLGRIAEAATLFFDTRGVLAEREGLSVL